MLINQSLSQICRSLAFQFYSAGIVLMTQQCFEQRIFLLLPKFQRPKLPILNSSRFHVSANQKGWGFVLKFQRLANQPLPLWKEILCQVQKGANTYFRLRHAYLTYGDFFNRSNLDQLWRCKRIAQ